MDSDSRELTFEEAFARLEETVNALEAGGLSLAEMLALFEEGTRLVRMCHEQLDAGELRVSQLIASAAGELEVVPLRLDQA